LGDSVVKLDKLASALAVDSPACGELDGASTLNLSGLI
jgi:hypothetical protein